MRLLVFLVSFLLAFLLFAVQPMATKMVLPTLGGTPAVWNTAMFTFQFLLLAGYAYAHGLVAMVARRWQWVVHAAVIMLSCVVLPMAVTLTPSEAMLRAPIFYLMAAFVVQLGLPFFVLAATQPLLQAWVSQSRHPLAKTPYVLYSASNLGSFAGLLGYVGVVEPLLSLPQQSVVWSGFYVAGVVALLVAGHQLCRTRDEQAPAHDGAVARLPLSRYAAWVWLAFLPSSLSLGVTTYITTDVAAVPLLWVMPLALYLLSFVDAFRARPKLVPICQQIAPQLGLLALLLYGMQLHRFTMGYAVHLLSFMVLAFALHGWLATLRPERAHLTRFYLCLSLGGALGGMLNGLVAPVLFNKALEYPLVLGLAATASFMLLYAKQQPGWIRQQTRLLTTVFAAMLAMTAVFYVGYALLHGGFNAPMDSVNGSRLVMAAILACAVFSIHQRRYIPIFYAVVFLVVMVVCGMGTAAGGMRLLYEGRNFFGVERVYDRPELKVRYLLHDTTIHGVQSLEKERITQPMSYYGVIGDIFRMLPSMHQHPMGVVGLGIGNVGCHAAPGQQVDYFEINPMVKQLAEDTRYFQQLAQCAGRYRVKLGDGRILLAQEPDASYGLLVLDAFSSDAIPGHLLTREAFAVYRQKLMQGGFMLLHVTNRHLDLWPLLGAQADAMGWVAYGKKFTPKGNHKITMPSEWVVLAARTEDLGALPQDKAWKRLRAHGDKGWTDHYINLLPYFKILRPKAPTELAPQ